MNFLNWRRWLAQFTGAAREQVLLKRIAELEEGLTSTLKCLVLCMDAKTTKQNLLVQLDNVIVYLREVLTNKVP